MRIWKPTLLGVLLSLSVTCANAIKTILVNYVELVKAVETADDVKAIIYFDHCEITDQAIQNQITKTLAGATTRFNFTKYLHYNAVINGQLNDTVTTSMISRIEQPTGELWIIFGRLSVFDDNTAILHVNYYDPIRHKKQLGVDWLCGISKGIDNENNKGLVLYDNP